MLFLFTDLFYTGKIMGIIIQIIYGRMMSMMNIVPVSELKNYNQVLNKVKHNNPVILTKNGYGKYAVIDVEDLQYWEDIIKLQNELQHSEKSGDISLKDAFEKLGKI